MATYKNYKTYDGQKIQVESAIRDGEGKNISNNYAKQNGYYKEIGVGNSDYADNLTPYSEESGVNQDIPFILQGTGCGNGEAQVDTGSFAYLKEKQGNSVVVNQLVKNGNFANGTTNWAAGNTSQASISVSNNVATVTITSTTTDAFFAGIKQSHIDIPVGHKVYISSQIKYNSQTQNRLSYAFYQKENTSLFATQRQFTVAQNTWQDISQVATIPSTGTSAFIITPRHGYVTTNDTFEVKNVNIVDLTKWFGSNENIPQYLLDHPESAARYGIVPMVYNTGGLITANATVLKTYGRQQWDEEWEHGYYSPNGAFSSTTCIRSKNYISVIPNTTYYYKGSVLLHYIAYNKDKISLTANELQTNANTTFTIPANCCYLRFYVEIGEGLDYQNDITLSLYYDGESGYDEYYPYEVLDEVDTGTEVLRSVGSVKDIKTPDGTIMRKIGVMENVSAAVGDVISMPLMKPDTTNVWRDGSLGMVVNWGTVSGTTITVTTALTSSYNIYYELATPTTEQGTPFKEVIIINDFGSMEWDRDDETAYNGIPQGCKIFYPVDYKSYVDSLANYTEGDVTEIAKKSDLIPAPPATDGEYTLKATVSDGAVVYTWVLES